MVKMLSLSFRVRNFLPRQNPGQPFVRGAEEQQPSPGLGTSPASHHLGLLLPRREPGDPRVTQTQKDLRGAPLAPGTLGGGVCEDSFVAETRTPPGPSGPTASRAGQDGPHPLPRCHAPRRPRAGAAAPLPARCRCCPGRGPRRRRRRPQGRARVSQAAGRCLSRLPAGNLCLGRELVPGEGGREDVRQVRRRPGRLRREGQGAGPGTVGASG